MTAVGEKIVYSEYDATNDRYVRYTGVVRVVPGPQDVEVRHGIRHLTIEDEEAPNETRQVNNVPNLENFTASATEYWGEDFWTHDLESQI